MKLISMTDFVLEHPATTDYEWQLSKHLKYANFLKQPLKLEMFVPCDEYGNVLEYPVNKGKFKNDELCKYERANEKILFEGFALITISKGKRIVRNTKLDCQVFVNRYQNIYYKCLDFQTIEDLVKYRPTLTENALKQIGL